MKKNQKTSIRQAQDKNQKSQGGYTLVELLAVMSIVIVVGVIAAGILTSSLRGGSKSNVLDNVRQNGNSAITQISKMITYSQNFNGISTDGSFYRTNCTQIIPPSPSPTPTPVVYKYIKITSFDGGQTIFSCNGSTLASNGASLIDTSSVSVVLCSFSCTQDNFGQAPTIGINLTLSQNNPNNFAEKGAIIPFQTSVTIRNNNL
ncbi:MAG: type II secretion system GspH family protein [Patescibacteria group bacterium]|nr:type II secretion system GspH family protein [Patescibacteria group bacterium]